MSEINQSINIPPSISGWKMKDPQAWKGSLAGEHEDPLQKLHATPMKRFCL